MRGHAIATIRPAYPWLGLREKLGEVVGRAWAPAIAAITRARHARMFHPVGLMFEGHVEPVPGTPYRALAERLDGRVLVRCSQALWKRPLELFDVLGIALRFRHPAGPAFDARAVVGDQDLLFATIISPLTMLVSPLTTNAHDFLANTYFGVAPFALADQRRIKLRLRPTELGPETTAARSRDERLLRAVLEGRVSFVLEARPTLARGWSPVVRIGLEQEIDLDQGALRFDPFRDGAGLEPVGLVHAIRRAAYAAGQAARVQGRATPEESAASLR